MLREVVDQFTLFDPGFNCRHNLEPRPLTSIKHVPTVTLPSLKKTLDHRLEKANATMLADKVN